MAQKNIIKRIISNPLVQTFLIYVSGGWIVLEMSDYFINKYALNESISDVLSLILLIGLPLVIILTWYLGKESEEEEDSPQDIAEGTLFVQRDQGGRTTYSISRRHIIFPGILILLAITITAILRISHQSNIKWAREIALPKIEEIANDMTWEGYQSWIAFDLASKASKYIPNDPLLIRLEQSISWNVKLYTDPSDALVYIKSYEDVDTDWKLLGKTPIDEIRLPRGLSKVKIEKNNYRTVYDLIWKFGSLRRRDSLYYLLPESGSIPEEMEMLPEASISYDNRISFLKMPGMEGIEIEKTGDFLMDRFEVTNADYKRFMDSGGYKNLEHWKHPFVKEGELLSWEEAMAFFIDKTGRTGPATWQIGDFPDGEDDYPVSGISWYEAAAYAESLGKSLPTLYHWYRAAHPSASGMIIPISNINKEYPLPVGASQSMNRFGIYDLAGNVREWCFNMTERGHLRYILGGGWNDPGFSFNVPYAQGPFDRSETNGFRCIAYLESDENRMVMEKPIARSIPDFLNKPKVADEIFAMFKKQYLYDKTDLNSVIEEIVESDDHIKQKITFDAAYGNERMMAYLFLPKTGKGPYQTVIFFPGSGVIRTRSSEQIDVNEMFVKSGRALLYPIYKSTFERGDGLTSDRPTETSFYKEHVIMWVKDLSRSIDYLESRNDIDTSKLAYFGFSWGGTMGAFIPAIDRRFKACVLHVGGLFFQPSLPEVDPVHYLPRVTTPTLMLNGKYDYIFPYETSQLPFYQLLGTPQEHKEIFLYEYGHAVPRTQYVKKTLDWLERYLGPVNE